MKHIEKILDEIERMYPYKVVGVSHTYSDYNKGWSAAVDEIRGRLEDMERETVAIFPSDKDIFRKVSELSKSSPSTAQLRFYSWLKSQVIRLPKELTDEDAIEVSRLIANGEYESSKKFWEKLIKHFTNT